MNPKVKKTKKQNQIVIIERIIGLSAVLKEK